VARAHVGELSLTYYIFCYEQKVGSQEVEVVFVRIYIEEKYVVTWSFVLHEMGTSIFRDVDINHINLIDYRQSNPSDRQ
jgi:hypothetical protein